MKKSLSKSIAQNLAKYRFLWLLFSLLLIGALAPNVKNLGADFSYRIWFRTTDPMIKKFDEFEKRFGNDDSIIILINTPGEVFTPNTINLIKDITKDMWNVADIIRVDSLINYQWTHATGDEIIIEDFIPDEFNEKILSERKKIALKHEVIPDYLLSKNSKIAIIYAKVRPFPGSSPNDLKLIQDSRKVLLKYQESFPNHEFYINGSTAINNTFKEVSEHDLKLMIPLVMLFILVFLVFSFKNISGVVIPFLIIAASLVSTFAFSALLGIKFNNMITIIPNIIIAIAIADTVHILVTYFQFKADGLDKKEAMIASYEKNIKPIFLTSISTAIGFLSFALADLIPLAQLGVLASFGTMIAWLLTMTLVGPVLAIFNIKTPKKSKGQTSEAAKRIEMATKLFRVIKNHRYKIVVSFGLLFFLSLWVALKNEVNSNPYTYFTKEVPLRQANDFGLKEMGGVTGPEIVVDSGQVDGIKEPVFLKRVEHFQDWLLKENYITRVISIIDIIKGMNRSFNGDIKDYFKVPDSQESIAELLFLYTMSLPQGMDLNDRMTLDNRFIRMTALWNSQDSKTALKNIAAIENKAKEIGLNVMVTGKLPLYQGMNSLVVSTFFTSIAVALIGITLLLIAVFQSIKIGLISMIPNIVPLGLGAALMTILEKPIDIGTALVTSVCLGIVVDDTIHFLTNFYKLIKNGAAPEEAIIKVLANTGPALITTTVILMVGFGVLAFAQFIPNVNFGILSASVLGVALIIDLIFLPALLLIITKKKTHE